MKKWSSLVLSAALMLSVGATAGAQGYTAGTYQGSAYGRNGSVTVEVTLTEDAIADVQVVSSSETENIGTVVQERMPKEIVETQSIDVDNVSGATFTSNAIKNAVKNALTEAGVDVGTLAAAPEKAEGSADCRRSLRCGCRRRRSRPCGGGFCAAKRRRACDHRGEDGYSRRRYERQWRHL